MTLKRHLNGIQTVFKRHLITAKRQYRKDQTEPGLEERHAKRLEKRQKNGLEKGQRYRKDWNTEIAVTFAGDRYYLCFRNPKIKQSQNRSA